MSVRLVHPPRAAAGGTPPLSGQFPAAANDAHVDEPRGLWFPSCAPDLAVVGVIVLLLLLASVLLGMYEPAPRAEWFSMWGIAK